MKTTSLIRQMAKRWKLVLAAGLIFYGGQIIGSGLAWSAAKGSKVHLRLVDRLDRPEDGYCLDIPGAPPNLLIRVPLFVHNCNPSLKSDNTVMFTAEGYIRFPAVDRCVTAAGVKVSLPGASIMLGKCNPPNPVIDVSKRQRFTHHKNGTLALTGTNLCLAVGDRSAPTLSPVHRWRTLFVVDCTTANSARSRWEFVVPRK